MEPVLPLEKIFAFSHPAESFIAVLLGIGFGFALENGGLGNAKVLAGQWFGYNFAVLRVMFTAVVVAMLGIFGLHYLGVLNLELVYINPTYFWPQLVGGLVFGLGFAFGQHCPGTAVVGASTGNWDAMSWLVGFLAGVVGFAFLQPYIDGFYNSSAWGRLFIFDALHVPFGVVVVAIVAMALGAFALVQVLDKKLGNTPPDKPTFDRVFVGFGSAVAVVTIAVFAASLRGEPRFELAASVDLPESRRVLPEELAGWIVSGKRDFVVVDMRSSAAFEHGHVRGAVNCGSCHQSREEGRKTESFVDLSKKLVLYTQNDTERITLPKVLKGNRQIYRLTGGWAGWQREVMSPVSFDGATDQAALDALKQRDAIRAFMSGERGSAPVAPKVPVAPVKRQSPHVPAGGSEGC